MATFNGTAGNDSFSGTAANDVFNYGNVTYNGQTVVAGRGLDTISSGGGFDQLTFANLRIGYVNADRVGNDLHLYIQPIEDWNDPGTRALGGVKITNFFAANGNGVIDRVDFVDAYALSTYDAGIWRAMLYGPGDVLQRVTVDGSAGNDSLVGTALRDDLEGFGGNDTLSGLAGDDELDGGDGNDRLDGGAGNDWLEGGRGIDTVSYSAANGGVNIDLQFGTASGLGATNVGSDRLFSIERATGGSGNDRLIGNAQANLLNGGAGNDQLVGNAGNDNLLGGAGNDSLTGGADNDLLTGGAGNDLLSGGAGTDLFRFNASLGATVNVDRISDFVVADDTLQLDDAVFVGIGARGALAAGAFRAGTAAGDADDRVIYDSASGKMFYDADGNGAGAQVLFAVVAAGTVVGAADYMII